LDANSDLIFDDRAEMQFFERCSSARSRDGYWNIELGALSDESGGTAKGDCGMRVGQDRSVMG